MLMLNQLVMKFKGDSRDLRSRLIMGNVIKSFAVKIASTVITLALVPVSLSFLNQETYGVWLTLASVITWFQIFDFGLANGLTNRLAESLAKSDFLRARKLLSTSYFILILIGLGLALGFWVFCGLVPWERVFNSELDRSELGEVVLVSFLSFVFVFVLKPITSLLMARQQHFLSNLIQVFGNLLALVAILFAGSIPDKHRLIFFATVLSFSYPVSLLLFSVVFYLRPHREFRPSASMIQTGLVPTLFGLSLKFFVIQVCVIAVLTANNFFIAHFVSNLAVTQYNIAFRLYSIVSIFQMLFLQPIWTGFTDAFSLKDFDWIRKAIKTMNVLNVLLCLCLIFGFLLRRVIYDFWVGSDTIIPVEIDFLLVVYFMGYLFMQTYVSFVNGVGAINLQALLSVLTIAVQVPAARFLMVNLGFGVQGLLLLNIFWVLVSLVLWKWQTGKVLSSGQGKWILR